MVRFKTPSVKIATSTRHHFDTGVSYSELLVKTRAAEVEFKSVVLVASVVSAPLPSVDLQATQKRLCSFEVRLTQMTSSAKIVTNECQLW